MLKTNADLKLVELLLKYVPKEKNLQWENALLIERQANNFWICNHNPQEAIALFIQTIQIKQLIIDSTPISDSLYDKRVISLGKTIYSISKLYREVHDFQRSEEALNELTQRLRSIQSRNPSAAALRLFF